MAEQPENQPISDEERATWVREQFQKANKFLAENGVLFDSVITEESRYLMPYLAVWKIRAMDSKRYWVISGALLINRAESLFAMQNAPDLWN